jgi:hypothetical protein
VATLAQLIMQEGEHGMALMHCAVRSGDLGTVQVVATAAQAVGVPLSTLLAHQSATSGQARGSSTPLHLLAVLPDSAHILEWLLSQAPVAAATLWVAKPRAGPTAVAAPPQQQQQQQLLSSCEDPVQQSEGEGNLTRCQGSDLATGVSPAALAAAACRLDLLSVFAEHKALHPEVAVLVAVYEQSITSSTRSSSSINLAAGAPNSAAPASPEPDRQAPVPAPPSVAGSDGSAGSAGVSAGSAGGTSSSTAVPPRPHSRALRLPLRALSAAGRRSFDVQQPVGPPSGKSESALTTGTPGSVMARQASTPQQLSLPGSPSNTSTAQSHERLSWLRMAGPAWRGFRDTHEEGRYQAFMSVRMLREYDDIAMTTYSVMFGYFLCLMVPCFQAVAMVLPMQP